MIGEPCGYHGPYTFFKGIRIAPISTTTITATTLPPPPPLLLPPPTALTITSENDYRLNYLKNNNCLDAIDRKTAELLRSNDTIIKTIKHEYDDSDSTSEEIDVLPLPRKFHKTEVKPRIEGW